MSSEISLGRAAGFGFWTLIFGFHSIVYVSHVLSNPASSLEIALVLPFVTASLEGFLLLKTASYIPITSSYTTRFHSFFYESRKGSLTLLALCTAWSIYAFTILAYSLLDVLFTGGTSNRSLEGVLVYPVMLGWLVWTGAKALWRITTPVGRGLDQEAGIAISADDNDEWDEWRENRGN
ncbi:Fc.00g020330.m01.CDS01 [Cosmosporella sp. VM-42]